MEAREIKHRLHVKWIFAYFLLIIGAVFWIYGTYLNSPFQFDDLANFLKNFSIRKIDFSSQFMHNSRWFGELINKINFKFGEFNPKSYRLLNIFIHLFTAFSGLILFQIIFQRKNASKFLTENLNLLSLFAFGLFLLHPVQTQTVSYVIQGRLEGLASGLALFSLIWFTLALESLHKTKKILFLVLSQIFLFLGVCTKEIAVVAPALGLLIDIFWISNFSLEKLKKNLWLHLCYFSVPILFLLYFFKLPFFKKIFTLSAESYNNRGNILTTLPSQKISAISFMASQLLVMLHYLRIFILPTSLCVDYDYTLPAKLFSLQVIIPFSILASITGFLCWKAKDSFWKPISFSFLWFCLTMSPRMSVIPCPELACDYKTYLASIGFLFLISYVFLWILSEVEKILFSNQLSTHFLQAKLIVFGIILIACTISSHSRNKVWQSPIDFWQDIVNKNPKRARPLNNLGVALTEAEKYDEAIEAYKKAIALDNFYPDPLSNLAVTYSKCGRDSEAILALKRAVSIVPDYAEGYNNLAAMIFKGKGNIQEALQLLETAIKIRPHYGKAHYNMGRCFLEQGKNEEAWQSFKKATEGDLDTAEGFLVLGAMSQQIGKHQEAVDAFTLAIKKGDSGLETKFSLANSLVMLGKLEEGERHYREIISLNPKQIDQRVVCNLGEVLVNQQKFSDALDLYQKYALNFIEYPQALFRTAFCIEQTSGPNDALAFLENKKDKILETIKDVETKNQNLPAEIIARNQEITQKLRDELGRLRLQMKMKSGNGTCSFTGQEFQDIFNI